MPFSSSISFARHFLLFNLILLYAGYLPGQDCTDPPSFADGSPEGVSAAAIGILPDAREEGEYYQDVTTDGKYALLELRNYDSDVKDAFHVYERTEAGWVFADEVAPNINEGGHTFAGEFVFVGDPEQEQVLVYRRNEQGSWLLDGELENPFGNNLSSFGMFLAATDDYLVVLPRFPEGQNSARNIFGFVYRLVGEQWILDGELKLDEADLSVNNDETAVAVQDDRVVLVHGEATDRTAYIFDRKGTRTVSEGRWPEAASFKVAVDRSSSEPNIAMWGNQILFGTGTYEEDGTEFGAAIYVYEQAGTSDWNLLQTIELADDMPQEFGSHLYIANDILILPNFPSFSVANDEDPVYDEVIASSLYVFSENDGWSLAGSVDHPRPPREARLPEAYVTGGYVVAASGGTFLYLAAYAAEFDSSPSEIAEFFFSYDLSSGYILPAQSLTACAAPGYRPEVTSDCDVTLTADPTVPTEPGTYEITWTALYADGNGLKASQQITVTEEEVVLPLLERFTVPPGCWNADPAWTVIDGAYHLLPNDEQTDNNFLALPPLNLEAESTYDVSFQYRAIGGDGGGQLRLGFVGEQPFFADDNAPSAIQRVELLVTPPADGEVTLIFSSPRDEMGEGILLDDVRVAAYDPPVTDGAEQLAGNSDDACTSVRAPGIDGNAWRRILTDDGKLLAEINANGNTLGSVDVAMTDYRTAPTAPFTSAAQLGRYYSITPENGNGPYTENGGVRIRLYVTDTELSQLETASGETLDWANLIVTHYSGANEDCDLLNSTDNALTIEDIVATGDYGESAQYVEFTTTSFSEFGLTYKEAVSVNPGWAEPLTGLHLFPNPAKDHLTVSFRLLGTAPVELRLTDLFGRNVGTRRLEARAGQNRTDLDLSGLPAGTYQLTVTDGTRAGVVRVVKR